MLNEQLDTESEMNQFYYNDISNLVRQFPTADAKTKFMIMKKLKSLTESFLDYYDYFETEE
jgi:hypothetical protein